MNEILFTELVKNGPLIAVLAMGAWGLWKRYDKNTEKTENKLALYEEKINKYILEDRMAMSKIIEDNTAAMSAVIKSVDRANKVTACLIEEIQEFKKSEIYKQHIKEN